MGAMGNTTLQHQIRAILGGYVHARTSEAFAGHSLRAQFDNLKQQLAAWATKTNNAILKIKWSMGQGSWAKIPWIALLDERETDTTQHGIYCAYLFRQDMSGIYLTIMQGVTQPIKDKGESEAYSTLRARARELRPLCIKLGARGFMVDEDIDLRADSVLGKDYESAVIAHKLYEAASIPDDAVLLTDLEALISVYDSYLINKSSNRVDFYSLSDVFVESTSSSKSALRANKSAIVRLEASALSKRFLILTGLSGSGKTKLAQAFSRWITPKPANDGSAGPYYALVPVGADWTGNENVLGYPDGLDRKGYVSRPALELILHAQEHQEVPHFLILDEMNLSHVERYFADILSAIESEEKIPLHRDEERQANGRRIPGEIALPGNLFVIGTVNVDETTYMFSPKVLDRANVIEFRMDAGELEGFLGDPAKPDLSKLDGRGASFGKAFVDAAKGPADVPADAKDEYKSEMLLFFRALQAHNAEFGYRVAHEAARFVHFYKLLSGAPDDGAWFAEAFDCVIVQKFLPKLHGSRAKLGPLLKKLWFLCVTPASPRDQDLLEAAEKAARSTAKQDEPSTAVPDGAPYPLSAEKIGRMWRLLNENGFASFAEA
jgi:5-methylcytosine-specific restriction protein B